MNCNTKILGLQCINLPAYCAPEREQGLRLNGETNEEHGEGEELNSKVGNFRSPFSRECKREREREETKSTGCEV